MAIKEVPGKLFQSDRVIRCIAVNCSGNVTGDFAKEIKEDYPEVIKPYTEMCRVLGEKALGEVQFTVCHDDTIVASMFVQEVGIGNRAIVNSNILEECLDRICIFSAKTQLTTGFPENLGVNPKYIDWDVVKPLISAYLDAAVCNCQIITKPQRKGKAAATETPAEAPAPAEIPAPAEAPAEVPAEIPAPAEAPAEVPAEIPAPAEVPAEVPAEAPAEAPAETPASAGTSTSAEKPKEDKKRRVVVIRVETTPDSKEWTATLRVKAGQKQIRGTAGANPPALTGAVTALCALKTPCNVVLYSDDESLVETIQQGVNGKEGLWEKVWELMRIHNVVAHHSSEIPMETAS